MSKQRILLYIFLIFAIVYLVTIPFQPYSGHFIIKTIPILCLATLAFIVVPRLRGKLLFVALLFAAAGDVILALEAGAYFVLGLGLFLIAHTIYIVTFAMDLKMNKLGIIVALILVLYAMLIAAIMGPSLKDLAIPVYVYLVIITTMGIMAAFRDSSNKLVLYGAIVFIASDSMIAINKFLVPVLASDYLIMTTYYLAQFLIVSGFLKEVNTQFANK